MTMSVVGLTLGKAAKAIRPAIASAASAATRATTCAGGRERSYQAKPPSRTAPRIRKLASSQVINLAPRAGGPTPCSGVTTPGTSRTRATSVAKYQPPERISAAGPSAITTPSPSRTTRSAKAAANSTSWVATTTAAPPRGEPLDQLDEVVLAGAVHAPGRLVEGDQAGQRVAVHPPRERDRQGQPLALAAGEVARVAVDRVLQPDRPQRRLPRHPRQLVADPLADQIVARVLRQQRHPVGDLDPSLRPARPGRRPRAAACSCRRRCAPSARPARRGSTLRSTPRSTSCAPLVPLELDPEIANVDGARAAAGSAPS